MKRFGIGAWQVASHFVYAMRRSELVSRSEHGVKQASVVDEIFNATTGPSHSTNNINVHATDGGVTLKSRDMARLVPDSKTGQLCQE